MHIGLVMGLMMVAVVSKSQVFFTNAAPSVTINFSNTTPTTVGSNPSTAFTGAGFSPNPTNAGRLNSNAWAITGWSDGNLAFGGTQATVTTDFTRGSTAVAVTTGGVYAFTGAPQSAANPCLMVQPVGGEFTPGTITLRLINNGTAPITSLAVSYNLFVRNDQDRSSSFNFSYSVDDAVYTQMSALDYISPAALDAAGWVLVGGVAPSRSTNITGLNIAPGSSIYIRWSSADVGGTGSRDEFGLDDISLTASYTALPTNVASNPGINWVGSNQTPTAYAQPLNCSGTSPFVLKYRRVATTVNNPSDGRGQWTTTLNAQASGADVSTTNMTGGTNSGFLFTSGGSCGFTGLYTDKWVFGSAVSATRDVVNGNTWFTSGGSDMGLNMSTPGYYTFVLRDAGYANSNFYVGYTAAAPVSISHTTSTQVTLNGDYSLTVDATLSTTRSPEENFYLRYRVGTNDFTTGTSLVQGSAALTTVTFTIPAQAVGATVYYYIFSTTVANGTLNGYSESDKSLAALRVADNSNNNFAYTIPASTTYTWNNAVASGAWTTATNWTPNGVPGNGDAVVFNNGTAVTVTAVPSVNLRSVTMTGAGDVTWQAAGSRTVNVGFTGAANPVFSLAAGKQLNFSGTLNPIVLNIKSGFTATVAGTIVFSGPSGSVDHRLTGEAANAITFQSGSRFVAGTFFGGNPFGATGVSNTVVFASGSIYDYFAGGNPFATNPGNSKVLFQAGSLYRHNDNNFPASNGVTYANFEMNFAGSTTMNASSNAMVMDNLTVTQGTLILELAGTPGHAIRGNISVANGTTLNFVPTSAGTVNLSGTAAQTISGAGTINIGANSTVSVSNTTAVLVQKNINCAGTLTVASNGRLEFVDENFVTGTGTFSLQNNSTLGIGSAAGITTAGTAAGNVRTTTRTFISNAHYLYNGSVNQVSGTGLPGTVSLISVSNPTQVTLTATTTTTRINLNTGLFLAGTGQALNIANGGEVYSGGGRNPNNAAAGDIVFLGGGQTFAISNGLPELYSVIINGSVDFNGSTTNSATILNRLQLNAGSNVTDAPFYNTGSSLVYSTGGNYNRNVEWGSASAQGYPHHVIVQGNTTVNLNNNPILPAELSIAGDLTLGNTTGWGRVVLNGGMNKPLQVRGNLIIGNADVNANTSELSLSTTIGGDLWLHGNFTRHNGSFYTDNSRAIYFLGAGNSTVNTPGVTIVAGVPTQNFSFARIDKSVATADVTLNCPVGINNELTLQSGTITSSNTNLLVMYDNSTVTGMNYGTLTSGGSDNSFVNGPMKKTGNDAFVFPVGKLFAANPLGGSPVGGHRLIAMSAPANTTDEFTAQFYVASAGLVGSIVAPALPQLVWVSRCEYWRLEKNTPAAATVNVTLSWNASSNCNVSYVTNLSRLVIAGNTSTSYSDFSYNTGTGNWNRFGATSNTGGTGAGTITWNGVNAFGPFALGSINANDNPLPFELNAFRATGKKDRITLDWQVSKNDLQEAYTIERSRDGRVFEPVATVAATSARTASYSLDDLKPFNGWNYYRLRARDKKDILQSSSILKVWWGKESVMSILPNPAQEKIVINLSDPSSIQQIQLVNSNGQLLQQFSAISFVNEVNVSSLQAGIYYIRFIGKNGAVTKTFVKQ